MPNRATKDELQGATLSGTLHRFAQSMGLSPRDTDDKPAGTPTAPPPKVDPPTGIANAAAKLEGQQKAIDKSVSDAGG
jgi:hypothetical protein